MHQSIHKPNPFPSFPSSLYSPPSGTVALPKDFKLLTADIPVVSLVTAFAFLMLAFAVDDNAYIHAYIHKLNLTH
jgi:hypothetical protein